MKQYRNLIICFLLVLSSLGTLLGLYHNDYINFTYKVPTNTGTISKKFNEFGGTVHNLKTEHYLVLNDSTTAVMVDNVVYHTFKVGDDVTLYKEEPTIYMTFTVMLSVILFLLCFIALITTTLNGKGYIDALKAKD